MNVILTNLGRGRIAFAFVGRADDTLDWLALMESKAGEVKAVFRDRKEKPVVGGTTTGVDSDNVSPKDDCNCKVESIGNSTPSLNQQAIDALKRLATSSQRGKAIEYLIRGDIVTSGEYSHICSLIGKLRKILGERAIGRKPVARRGKDGKVRTVMGYYLTEVPTIQ